MDADNVVQSILRTKNPRRAFDLVLRNLLISQCELDSKLLHMTIEALKASYERIAELECRCDGLEFENEALKSPTFCRNCGEEKETICIGCGK